jgi:hypothetical protein
LDEGADYGYGLLQSQIAAGPVRTCGARQWAGVRGPVDVNGARYKDPACEDKVALAASGGAVIRNVRVTDSLTGLDANCLRRPGGTGALKNLTCRGARMGAFGFGQRSTIQESHIAESRTSEVSIGHLTYASAMRPAKSDSVTARMRPTGPGASAELPKSSCAKRRTAARTLDGGRRGYVRMIDAFNGGYVVISDSIPIAGSAGASSVLIGYGAKMREPDADTRVRFAGAVLHCHHLPGQRTACASGRAASSPTV